MGEYEDAGKSGKSIAGRAEFKRMMEDIEADKDGASYVLVFKLSRFGRNAADVLNSLQLMQDFGVNMICVEDGIDSSKDSGKLMISVLSAVVCFQRKPNNMDNSGDMGLIYGYVISLVDIVSQPYFYLLG